MSDAPNAASFGFDYKIGGTVVFTSVGKPFSMGRQFTRYSFQIKAEKETFDANNNRLTGQPPERQIWGLGEQVTDQFYLQDGIYTFWNRDSATTNYDVTSLPGKNIYGTHPFIMYKGETGDFVGVFFNSINAMDVVIQTLDGNTKDIIFSTNGGIIDTIVFHDPSPLALIQKYHSIVGKPALVPEWSYGWHQCRWGYNNLDKLKAAVKGYKDNSIPLDTIWSDIDYMEDYRDFTIDAVNFPTLSDWVVNTLHKTDFKHYIPIIDAGISYRPGGTYKAYNDGHTADIFVKIQTQDGVPASAEELIGQVWPNDAVFPDWLNTKTAAWWAAALTSALDFVDGIWLDMNEASNFCGGYCYMNQMPDKIDNNAKMMYTPGGRDLSAKSMPI